jgi:hypothetical protein
VVWRDVGVKTAIGPPAGEGKALNAIAVEPFEALSCRQLWHVILGDRRSTGIHHRAASIP